MPLEEKGIFSSVCNMFLQIMKYPIQHPAQALTFILSLNMVRDASKRVYNTYFNEDNIKYPLDALHVAYRGPTYVYFPDATFNPEEDLKGWTTDRHPSGYYDNGWHEVTNSFNLERFNSREQENLLKRRSEFYHWCALEMGTTGYGDLLSHRSSCGDLQSTFGFYGDKNLQTLAQFHKLDAGFVVGIRAFGNHEYYSTSEKDNTSYRLVKISLDNIDMTEVNFEYNTQHGIAHVYVKDGEVCQHPIIDRAQTLALIQNWTVDCIEPYLKHLPNFASTVDWVISATDVSKALEGQPVENLLNTKNINIPEWQQAQEKVRRSPLYNHGIFALSRPRDYGNSYQRTEDNRRELKPPLLFNIGNN